MLLISGGNFLLISEQHRPIKHLVKDVEASLHSCLHDQTLENIEVGRLLKPQRRHVVHVSFELRWTPGAQLLIRVLAFELANFAISRRVLRDGDALPWQAALQEVHHDVAECDQIVAAGKFEPLVRIH